MSNFKPIPSVDFLCSRYSYDPTTGVLTSKFGRYRGKPITQTEAQGYVVVRINGKIFKAHRVIWKMMTGQEPLEEIDHDNRDRADNRWENLLDVTHTDNQWNRTAKRSSRTGLIGVTWHKRDQHWSSEIRVNNQRHWLGYFPTAEAAYEAYVDAAKRLRK